MKSVLESYMEIVKQVEKLLEEGRIAKTKLKLMDKSREVLKNENKRLIALLDKKEEELRELKASKEIALGSLIFVVSKKEDEIGKLREVEEERDSLRQVNKQLKEREQETAQNLSNSTYYGEEKDIIIQTLLEEKENQRIYICDLKASYENENKQLKEKNKILLESLDFMREELEQWRTTI